MYVGNPDAAGRREIVCKLLEKMSCTEKDLVCQLVPIHRRICCLFVGQVVAGTDGLSGAEITAVFRRAVAVALEQTSGATTLTAQHFQLALAKQ